MKNFRAWLVGMACLTAMAASAQWQWIDKDGRKVFSDRAPPADTPEKNILKHPGERAAAGRTLTATPPQAPADAAPRLSGKDKGLELKKQQADAAEATRKKAEDEKQTLARADNCARAQRAKATVDSGQRIARTNEQGEREIMDDVARAAESQRLQTIIDGDCR